MARIPFFSPGFRDDHLEEFVARFLSAGVSLVIDGPEGTGERKILRAFRSDKTGGVSQQGIDVIAKVEGGETWGFECKLYARGKSKWNLEDSKNVVEKATYSADRYFLIAVAKNVQREAIEYIENLENWEFWDADTLSSQFLSRVRLEDGLLILEEFFDRDAAVECYGLLRDDVLVTAAQFFASTRKSDRPFNHLTKLVGRRDVVEAIHQFVETSPKKVLLIPARGGEGKSRVLNEFADEFVVRHPGTELRFVNPLASPNAADSSLGYLLKKGVVVVHEDAHRTETIRQRILGSIAAEESAKIIITTRPRGIDAVRSVLRDCGIGVDEIEPLAPLRHLTVSEMTELASEALGKDPEIEPCILARWSDKSPLVCVVGGNLIRDRKLSPRDIPDNETFRNEVLARFEEQNLDTLAHRGARRREWLETLLRTLAVLAPYPDNPDTRKALANFLGVKGSSLEKLFSELEASELISKTKDGWRVGPDLFADHLVFISCIRESRASSFCEEIIGPFGAEHFPNLLRNLSEAEWRYRSKGSGEVDLTAPLWKIFTEQFRGNPFWNRREMLESWSAFSVFLPERSIELAKLAMDLKTAPEDEISKKFFLSAADHRGVIERIPAILKPVAIYHPDHQSETLDLLWRLGNGWSPPAEYRIRESDDHPWVVIGKAATFALEQPVDSVEGVVRWLGSRLNDPRMVETIDHPTSFLSLVLEPIFQVIIERSIWEEMSVIFQTVPLCVEATASARNAAFDIIESKIIPRTEIATLNAIPVLNAAASFRESISNVKLDRSAWRPSRLRAIELLRTCSETWKTEFVRFAVWQALAGKIAYEDDVIVVECAKTILRGIPRDSVLDLALSTLGNDGNLLLEENSGHESDYTNRWKRWKDFHPKVAAQLLEEVPDSEDLLDRLSNFDREARLRGYVPNWGPLLGGLVAASGALAEAAIARCFKNDNSFLDHQFGTLYFAHPESGMAKWDDRIAAAFRSQKTGLQRSALSTLQWTKEPPGPKASDAIVELLNSDIETDKDLAVQGLSESLSMGLEWAGRFLDFVPYAALSDSSFGMLVSNLVRGGDYRNSYLDFGKLRPILARIETLPEIHHDPYPGFLRIVSQISPRETYELIRRRIERFERNYRGDSGYRFHPVPYALHQWRIPGLELDSTFPEIVTMLAEKVRSIDGPSRSYWQDLFRSAVLLNDPDAGISVLRSWLGETGEPETVSEIADIFSIRDAGLIFSETEFIREILGKAATFGGDDETRVRFRLYPRSGGRSYSNGMLDSKYHWILEDARKAASANANDPILKAFYEQIVRSEERDGERHLEEFQNRIMGRM